MSSDPPPVEYRITVSLVTGFDKYPEVEGLVVKMKDSKKIPVAFPVEYLEWVKVTKLEEYP